jgi:hypothetical protein
VISGTAVVLDSLLLLLMWVALRCQFSVLVVVVVGNVAGSPSPFPPSQPRSLEFSCCGQNTPTWSELMNKYVCYFEVRLWLSLSLSVSLSLSLSPSL